MLIPDPLRHGGAALISLLCPSELIPQLRRRCHALTLRGPPLESYLHKLCGDLEQFASPSAPLLFLINGDNLTNCKHIMQME